MGQAVRGIAGTGSARRDRCPRGGDGDHRGAAERPEAMSDSTPNAVLDGLDYPSRELIASIGGRPVGVLSDYAGVWKFTYAPEWLAYAGRFALSPDLPMSSAPIGSEAGRLGKECVSPCKYRGSLGNNNKKKKK